MAFILNDQSEDKQVSHLKLKACALSNENCYANFKKAELIQLLKFYNCNVSAKKHQ